MRRTTTETVEATLTRLIKAMDSRTPVTITYLKEVKDEDGRPVVGEDGLRTGELEETVRTIEIYDFVVTLAGYITIKAMDRETGESRTFRLDRITTYTVHRSATYAVARDDVERDEKPDAAPTLCRPRMETVADLDDVDPVTALAYALAA
jgi:predicted DNA-binding transcriptional regulator YafY